MQCVPEKGFEKVGKHSFYMAGEHHENIPGGNRGLVQGGMGIHGTVPLAHVPQDLCKLGLLKIEQKPKDIWH